MRRVVVAQLGAREAYSVAAMAERHGCLARLITDWWNPAGPAFQRLGDIFRSNFLLNLAGRWTDGVPRRKVATLKAYAVRWGLRARFGNGGPLLWERAGQDFARKLVRYLDVPHDVFFGYTSASLEAMEFESRRGRRTILAQIDAAEKNLEILEAERKTFPELSTGLCVPPETYFRRVRTEWELASAVIVNSSWAATALIEQGVTPAKIHIVPLTLVGWYGRAFRRAKGLPLRVLWLGTLSLLKGIAYAVEAARDLLWAPVAFTFAGRAEVPIERLRLPPNARYVGPVPRLRVSALYGAHDLFLFPTLSDGFGITQLEAMAHGLPVIATSCCGEVVEHGVSGFIVEPRNARAIANAILKLLDLDLLQSMSEAALARCEQFSPERVWPRLQKVLFLC